MPPKTATLVNGPQDGAKVTIGGDNCLPLMIHVGSKWLGDGYAAWAREPSAKKPAAYAWSGKDATYWFFGWQTEEPAQEKCATKQGEARP